MNFNVLTNFFMLKQSLSHFSVQKKKEFVHDGKKKTFKSKDLIEFDAISLISSIKTNTLI